MLFRYAEVRRAVDSFPSVKIYIFVHLLPSLSLLYERRVLERGELSIESFLNIYENSFYTDKDKNPHMSGKHGDSLLADEEIHTRIKTSESAQ